MLLLALPLTLALVGDLCISDLDRADVAAVHAALDRRISGRRLPRIQPQLQWPLEPAADFKDFNYFVMSQQVDHDPGPGILDYNCGARTYDGHLGTDIGIYPFPWNMMDAETVTVVAAAPGKIVFHHDGEFDKNCDSPSVPANKVAIQHADGSIAWYVHLKQGSLTAKQVGDTVVAGEALGDIGSSGHSSGPHLHFEVYDADKKLIDPFHVPGGCNALNPAKWWAEQLPYHDPRVQRIMFSDAPVEESPVCGVQAVTHERASFCPSETVYLYRFFTGIDIAEPVTVTLRDPNDKTAYQSVNQLVVAKTQRWLGQYLLPPKSQPGEWTLTIQHQGIDYTRTFTVDLDGCSPLPCAAHLDCPLGQICEAGTCTSGECATDADCGPDGLCAVESHTCSPAPADTTTTATAPVDPNSTTSADLTSTGEAMGSTTSPGTTTDDLPSTGTTSTAPPVPDTTDTATASPDTPTDPGGSDTTMGHEAPISTSTSTTGDVPSSTSTGATRPDTAIDEGCNCSSEPSAPALSLITLLVALGRRRRGRW